MSTQEFDVIVVGGGVTGIAAAVSAARHGARTALIEARPFVGGNATTGLCLHNYVSRLGVQAVFGFAQEIVDRLQDRGGAVGHVPYGGFVHSVTPVDGELFRIVATELLDDAGVTILYGAQVVDVAAADGEVKELTCAVKGGLRQLTAPRIVDASGDADVAVAAGARFRNGQEGTGKMQPVSMLLRCFNTDNARIAAQFAVSPPAMATRADHPVPIPVYFNGTFGRWNDLVLAQGLFPNRDHKVFFNTVWPNNLNVNTSAVFHVDGTDPLALSRATVQLTRHVGRIGDFLKAYVPGFENAYFMPAAFAGVRETRHIAGLYEISDDDVRQGRSQPDTIGKVCFPVDIHDPDTGQAHFFEVGGDGTFDIPYRALVPDGVHNVIVAGRCISVSSFAHGATRNMAPCLVMGEAAGAAAALSGQAGVSFGDLDVAALQTALRAAGVWPPTASDQV
ncbi:MAG: hypothetical protein QOF10_6129 [Kribbellaceae bacterium]|jgi:hypothetical protein|nr:hypothetical protein [Kribbellaceae bacterium]